MALTKAQATTAAASMSTATARILAAACIDAYLRLQERGYVNIAALGLNDFVAAVVAAFGDTIVVP